jgi:RNA polymerase sigma factor (sigma-70 family)
MNGQLDWSTFRACDERVERAMAAGAYREALDALVRGYQRLLLSYCRKRLGWVGEGGQVEDIVQEIFLTAYRVMPCKGPVPVRPWLFAIAQKRCLREYRKAQRRDRLTQTHQATVRVSVHQTTPVAPEDHVLSQAELDHVRASLAKLPKWARELLEKRFLLGYDIALLAHEYFCSETTVRNRLDAALTRCQILYRRLTKEL